jgi:hypothetical protein
METVHKGRFVNWIPPIDSDRECLGERLGVALKLVIVGLTSKRKHCREVDLQTSSKRCTRCLTSNLASAHACGLYLGRNTYNDAGASAVWKPHDDVRDCHIHARHTAHRRCPESSCYVGPLYFGSIVSSEDKRSIHSSIGCCTILAPPIPVRFRVNVAGVLEGC